MTDPTTHLLNRLNVQSGERDPAIEEEVFVRVERQLKRIARLAMRRIRRYDPTADTTGFVDELFIKLLKQPLAWQSREHYWSYVRSAMTRIVIDAWRRACAEKRGRSLRRVPLTDYAAPDESEDDFPQLQDVLELMKQEFPRAHQITWMFYVEGIGQSEIANRMGVSTATVTRDLRFGEAYLLSKLSNDGSTA